MNPEQILIAVGLALSIAGFIYGVFQYIFSKFKNYVDGLEKRVEALEAAKGTAEKERDAALRDAAEKTKLLDTERLEHTQTKHALETARSDHKADIRQLNTQHTKDVEAKVKAAVEDVTRQHQTTIDSLKRENTEAIRIAVDQAVEAAVKPLKEEIQRLKDEKQASHEREQTLTNDLATLQASYDALELRFTEKDVERTELKRRVDKIEKKDTDNLPPLPPDHPAVSDP